MIAEEIGPKWIEETFGVSRETLNRIHTYAELIEKWNPKINLVAKRSVADLWSRHICDSAQLMSLVKNPCDTWYDLGSGGGFPAIVCAVIAKETMPQTKFTCVESDKRKAAFLAVAAQTLDLNMNVEAERAETISDKQADVLSARALTSLSELLPYTRILKPNGLAIFPKGANHDKEIEQALAHWRFSVQTHPSVTNPEAAVLCIREVTRV